MINAEKMRQLTSKKESKILIKWIKKINKEIKYLARKGLYSYTFRLGSYSIDSNIIQGVIVIYKSYGYDVDVFSQDEFLPKISISWKK